MKWRSPAKAAPRATLGLQTNAPLMFAAYAKQSSKQPSNPCKVDFTIHHWWLAITMKPDRSRRATAFRDSLTDRASVCNEANEVTCVEALETLIHSTHILIHTVKYECANTKEQTGLYIRKLRGTRRHNDEREQSKLLREVCRC